jgi:hypothetical protein
MKKLFLLIACAIVLTVSTLAGARLLPQKAEHIKPVAQAQTHVLNIGEVNPRRVLDRVFGSLDCNYVETGGNYGFKEAYGDCRYGPLKDAYFNVIAYRMESDASASIADCTSPMIKSGHAVVYNFGSASGSIIRKIRKRIGGYVACN